MGLVSGQPLREDKDKAMMGYGWGMGLGGWIFMGLFWVLVIGLIVWAIVSLLPSARATGRHPGQEGPQEILDRRFAMGEIDAEQYRRAREELAATQTGRR